MGEVVAIILGIVFGLLSLLHVAWAIGVSWGFDASLPTNEDGKRVLNPTKRDSLIVAIGLGFFATFYALRLFGVRLTLSDTIEQVISWVIPSIFLLRTLGDFKYFGLFKKVKTTAFAILDSRLIIPLCLIISLLGFYLATMA